MWGVEVSERPVGQARVGVGGCLDLERAAHRDHLSDRVRRNPGQLASENATEAPPDDIDRAVLLVEFVDALDDAVEDLWRGSEVASEIPAVGGVAESIEGAPQRQVEPSPARNPGMTNTGRSPREATVSPAAPTS